MSWFNHFQLILATIQISGSWECSYEERKPLHWKTMWSKKKMPHRKFEGCVSVQACVWYTVNKRNSRVCVYAILCTCMWMSEVEISLNPVFWDSLFLNLNSLIHINWPGQWCLVLPALGLQAWSTLPCFFVGTEIPNSSPLAHWTLPHLSHRGACERFSREEYLWGSRAGSPGPCTVGRKLIPQVVL